MPRLTSATPKYRLHRASGQAVVTIAGRDTYLGPWKSKASRIEYDRLVGEWLAAGRPSSPPAPPHEITVLEICDKFLIFARDHYRKNGRPTGTADNYKPALTWLNRRYGHTAAVEFGPIALKAIRMAMIHAGNSRRYCNENIHRIRKIFRWASSEQLIPAAVYQTLASVEGLRKGLTKAKEGTPVSAVDDAIVEATLPHLSAIVADMIRFQRLTGSRPGEICALRPCDVDRTGEVWKYVPAEHKTEHHGHQRTIFIGPKAQEVLLPYLLRDAESHCFQPREADRLRRAEQSRNRKTTLSCGNKPGTNKKRKPEVTPGDCYTSSSYRRAVTRGCEIAFNMPPALRKPTAQKGVDGKPLSPEAVKHLRKLAREWRAKHVWHPHQLRHSAATEIRKRFGLEGAQVALGHNRMNITEVYTERNHELAARVAREVG